MNRAKKEELRKYREAREGLTPEEIVALERREFEAKAFADTVQLWHGRLFPEEYAFYFDSGADARDRARGKNPMSQDYADRADARRHSLGFAGYMSDTGELPSNTRGWVEAMVRERRTDELEALYDQHRRGDTESQ